MEKMQPAETAVNKVTFKPFLSQKKEVVNRTTVNDVADLKQVDVPFLDEAFDGEGDFGQPL